MGPEVRHFGMVLVFFVYGLAFFGMGLAIALESRRSSALPLATSLKYLAAFGLLHSAVEWLDMFMLIQGFGPEENFSLRVLRAILLAASTVVLIQFGAHLITGTRGKHFWLRGAPAGLFLVWLVSIVAPHLVWVPIPAKAVDLGLCLQCHRGASESYLALSSAWLSSADIWARYLLYLPGSLLAALAMLDQRRWFQRMGFRQGARDSAWASGAFAFNALVAGLIVPPGPYFPASVFNYANFFALVGIPPQIFRALAAFAIAFFIVRILSVFETERQRQLERAQQERFEAQRQAREQLEAWTRELEATVRQRTKEIEERNRELIILEERDRIAREMHDGLGQVLSYLSLKIMNLDRLLARDQKEQAITALQQMEVAVQDACADVRESILSLRTPLAPDGGLVPAVQEYLTKFGEQAGLRTELVVSGAADLSLSPVAQVQLLRIIQEALVNIRKHAQASEAKVTVQVRDREAEIAIADNGRGFDLEEVMLHRGRRFGLQTMRERAEEAGGTLSVETGPGRGTKVVVKLPLAEEVGHARADNGSAGG